MKTSTSTKRPATTGSGAPPIERSSDADVTRAFSLSVAASAIRCTLTYVVFPWVLPAVGVASESGPVIGIAVATVAIVFNVASIRRFWRSGHRWKWPVSLLNVLVIAMLLVLLVGDLSSLRD